MKVYTAVVTTGAKSQDVMAKNSERELLDQLEKYFSSSTPFQNKQEVLRYVEEHYSPGKMKVELLVKELELYH